MQQRNLCFGTLLWSEARAAGVRGDLRIAKSLKLSKKLSSQIKRGSRKKCDNRELCDC